MAADILFWISSALIVAGAVFVLIGAIGIVRMPDVYTRLHAASVLETLGAGLLLIGMMLTAGLSLVTLKLFFVLALIVFTAPVATHALAQAALHEKQDPILSEDRRSSQAAGADMGEAPGEGR